uniref:Putative transcriptional regulator, ModE family n=1 Tax=Nitratidesulfovibrio vulgaris (strain DSM 19637 / Miyazaki F) TaxID=883 RepID=B8DK11_NITV9
MNTSPLRPAPAAAPRPTVRLHLWLEEDGEMVFGMGRAMLLLAIDEHGSLKKAAEALGMSYRAAWGKLKQTETALGLRLVEKAGSNREGYRLTSAGREAMDRFRAWFATVERCAVESAATVLPWPVRQFEDKGADGK